MKIVDDETNGILECHLVTSPKFVRAIPIETISISGANYNMQSQFCGIFRYTPLAREKGKKQTFQ